MLNHIIFVQLLNLGIMKTVDKKGKEKKSFSTNKKKDHLIDHPEAHEILSKSKSSIDHHLVSDFIKLKVEKDKKSGSIKLLVSSISLCLSLILVIGAFEMQFSESKAKVDFNNTSNQFEDLMDIPQTQQVQKPPVQIQAPQIIEVDDEEIIEEIEVDLDIEMTEDTRIEEVVVANETEEMPEEAADEIFTIVEEQPSPVGGIKAFYKYVGANLNYPAQARRMGVEGRVYVEFIVEKDGSLTDIQLAKGIGGGCDEEAIRVLSNAPKWNPGRQRGNPVRVRMIMPINFQLIVN
jgi:protein TonB